MTDAPPAILADPAVSAQALEEATLRRRNEAILTGPVLDEPRSVIARRLAALVLDRVDDKNERRTLLDAIASNSLVFDGETQSSLRPLDKRVEKTLRDLYLVGVKTLVRSRRQAMFLGELFGRFRPGYVVCPGIEHDVPTPEMRTGGDTIVIWSPHIDAGSLGLYLFALGDIKAPIVIIGSGEVPAFSQCRIAPPAAAARELRQAALIVDATLSDPATAVALAGWKIPLVAASTSGADEFLDGVRLYDPWNWRSIVGAVCAARADAVAVVSNVSVPFKRGRTTAVRSTTVSDLPLVTIVVPTFNRLELLPLALDSLEAQSYPNIEMLVVNDAGSSIEDVVSQYSRARSIVNPANVGLFASCNVGIVNARGSYIGLLADDDIYYSDHVERLVTALEQSRASVAHSNGLTRFLEVDADGALRTSGNEVLFGDHLDVEETLWWGYLGCNLVRREVFGRIGMFDTTNAVADYEMVVRLSRSLDFIHVDHVTYEWRYRTDASTLSHNVGIAAIVDGLERIFKSYPSNGDWRVEKGRSATLAFIRDHDGLPYWEPSLRLHPELRH